MKPVAAEVVPEPPAPAPIAETAAPPVTDLFSKPIEAEPAPPAEIPEAVEAAPETVEPAVAAPVEEVAAPVTKAIPVPPPIYVQRNTVNADRVPASLEAEHDAYASKGGFYVTVIEEKNVKQRNALLLGTLCCMVIGLMFGVVYSLFAKDLDVSSIGGDDPFIASLLDNAPTPVEEEKQKKEKDDGGGGGGGGREEKQEVNKGDRADQTPDPIRPPDVRIPRLDNPDLLLPPPSTKGNQKFEHKYDVYGDLNGRFSDLSNGPGSGNGIGSGRGNGQGSGNGDGAGSGNGSGFGNGNGNGNGNGDGNGSGLPPPPPKHVGVTTDLKILAKPRPGYTDAARQANIQGTVILRVTFTSSGQIGSISTVKGLGNGLTEKAMEAARQIHFEPKKIDGVGQTVTKQIEYSFSIY